MSSYADTRFLFSLYVTDANSASADPWRIANPEPLPLTDLHRVEFRNALSLAVFQKRLISPEADAAWNDLETDLQNGSLLTPPLDWTAVFHRAEELAKQLTPTTGSRSLDVLHVAAAAVLVATAFVSFDDRQARLASQAGLNVIPLVTP